MKVLIVADECAQLGRMPVLETTLALGAGFGVQLITIWQDALQVKRLYGEGVWETFIAQSGAALFFGARDVTTSQYLSDLSGDTDRLTISKSISGHPMRSGAADPSVNVSYSHNKDRALYPYEIRNLDKDEVLLFAPECVKGYVRGRRIPYWEIPEFKGRYGINPLRARDGRR